MRIIGGTLKGRRIEVPVGDATRPTSDRAREAVFNVLEHGRMPLEGTSFLDLFAGSGAMGIEAASRGAARVVLVENDRSALEVIRHSLRALGLDKQVKVVAGDASRLARAQAPVDVAFLDPPYRSGLAEAALTSLLIGDHLHADSLVIAEIALRDAFDPPEELTVEEERRYGAARFVFMRLRQSAHASRDGVERTLGR